MARTLFFIEAAVLAALSLLFPVIAAQSAAAFLLPLAVSLVLPLAGAFAIWPPRSVLLALRHAFSPDAPADSETALVLESLGGFSRAAAVLGFLFWLAAASARLSSPSDPRTWTMLGAYISVYALVNAVLWRILAEIGRMASASSALGTLAEAYGLTPRESETASLIASGKSYKETAYELGISIRTVKAHMSRVYEKTGASSNVGLSLLLREKAPIATKVQ